MPSSTAPPIIPLNDLARNGKVLRHDVTAAIERVTRSGRYLQGPELEMFEQEFAQYLGVNFCVGVASGTDALRLALLAVGCEPNDHIIMAANAGMYAATAALQAGLQPCYADVDAETVVLSSSTIADAICPETRAVVVTHLYGRMAEIETIVQLCHEHGIALIEDCAQAAGAQRQKRFAGSFGDAAAFSFYPTKNLGALGDAGAVITNRDEVAARVRSLAQYGWDTKYRVVHHGGSNSRLDELQAAVLRTKLPHLDTSNSRRREIVLRYAAALPSSAGKFIVGTDDEYVAHLAVFLSTDREVHRTSLRHAGVATDIHYPIADHRQPVWKGTLDGLHLPVTETTTEQALTVPCFPELDDAEVDHICGALSGL